MLIEKDAFAVARGRLQRFIDERTKSVRSFRPDALIQFRCNIPPDEWRKLRPASIKKHTCVSQTLLILRVVKPVQQAEDRVAEWVLIGDILQFQNSLQDGRRHLIWRSPHRRLRAQDA